MIEYLHTLESFSEARLKGFFVGWPIPPSTSKFKEILQKSYAVIIAWESEKKEVVGFITAISDGVFSAFIPLLEVRPEYQGKGIGRELVKRMEERLTGIYSIDLVCDPELIPFYLRQGYISLSGQAKRFRKVLE